MLRKHSQTFLLLIKLFDTFIIIASFLFAYHAIFRSLTIQFQYVILLIAVIILWFSIATILKSYETQRTHPFLHEIRLLAQAKLIILFLISLPLFYFKHSFSRRFIVIYFASSFLGFLLLRINVRMLLRYIRKKGYNIRRLIIVGGGTLAKTVFDKVQKHPEFGYENPIILADVVENEELKPLIKGTANDLEKFIKEYKADDVIVAFPLSREKDITKIVTRCEMAGIRVRIVPDFLQFIHSRAIMEDFDNLPLIGLRTEPLLSLWNRIIKRSFDIVFSFFVLTLFLPLFIIIALLVKLTSKGPILFIQERVGVNNKPFNIYKFRTMYLQKKEESDTVWTTKNDSRITPLGKILRKTNLDELPQFYNVLIGNMSVVGPRPEREYFADKFASEIKAYRIRHLVRVGITGWAQVNGLRGDTSISERIKYDLYYIENWSFFFDIKIILMTVLGKNINAI